MLFAETLVVEPSGQPKCKKCASKAVKVRTRGGAMSTPKLKAVTTDEGESLGLYPGLVVHDGRVSGSITIGRSRLPLWAVACAFAQGGWPEVLMGWDYIEGDYSFTLKDMTGFLSHLLEMRNDFGRLLLVLANARRLDALFPEESSKASKAKVKQALQKCIDSLEATQ
jgi:hypothetical protein